MPRYLVQRAFPEGLHIPISEAGERLCHTVIQNNAKNGVTWIHSYVSDDLKSSFCIYDAPTSDAIRAAAAENQHPVNSVTEVRVLDPYFCRS